MEDGNATVPNFDMNHSFFWKINDTSESQANTKNAYKGSNSNAVLLVLLKKIQCSFIPREGVIHKRR